jgi:hypothetical protein
MRNCDRGFGLARLSYSQVIHILAVVVSAEEVIVKIPSVFLKKKVTDQAGKKFHLFQIIS